MERFQEQRELSKKKIQIADHMLTVTYPMIQDAKLLVAVLTNIFDSMNHAMTAILYYDRLFKRIPPFQENFDSKLNMFKARCFRRYDLDPEFVQIMQDLRDTLNERKQSPVEFARKDKFVICSNTYKMKTISTEKMKGYVAKAKLFIEKMSFMVSKNDGIFGR